MKKYFVLSLLSFIWFCGFAQQKPAYVLYTVKGKKASHKQMMKMLAKQDIVLFGEFHNNPISHWLQLEVTKELHAQRQLVLAAEMFEQDN
jgi:uncharacterized iron-regulated protein